jgi:tetratricopeptide (TPR) repeat protein
VLDDPWTSSPFAPAASSYDAAAPTPRTIARQDQRQSLLAEPFPRSWTLMVVAGVPLALLVAFLVQALIVRGDWAEAALVAGYTGLGLAAFAVVLAAFRFARGRRAPAFYLLTGLLLVVLLATGAGAVALAHQLHLVQAKSFENARQWDQAAREYALYGERAPNAPNLGRVYLRWGQDLAQKQAWSDAANHLSAALAANPSDASLAAQANTALYTDFAGWMGADAGHVPYPAAIESFTTQRGAPSCDAACQDQSATLEAQARYLYGQQLSTAQNYSDAAIQFSTIETQFATSAYVSQAHTAAATAYLALGQQQVASKTCTDAIPTYQTLSKTYSDTPEGKQAATALAAPQTVKGRLINVPTGNPVVRAHLSKVVNANRTFYSNEYNVTVDGATGAFTFTGVKQGAYNFSTSRDFGYKIDFHPFTGKSTGDLYFVKVGPLCSYDLGTTDYNPPS